MATTKPHKKTSWNRQIINLMKYKFIYQQLMINVNIWVCDWYCKSWTQSMLNFWPMFQLTLVFVHINKVLRNRSTAEHNQWEFNSSKPCELLNYKNDKSHSYNDKNNQPKSKCNSPNIIMYFFFCKRWVVNTSGKRMNSPVK